MWNSIAFINFYDSVIFSASRCYTILLGVFLIRYVELVYLFMHPLGKLLVTTGYPYENGQKSEIIDLLNPGSVCEDLPDFPIQVGAASGGLLLNNQPLICGGLSSNYELQCYIVGNGHFKLHLLQDRAWSSR